MTECEKRSLSSGAADEAGDGTAGPDGDEKGPSGEKGESAPISADDPLGLPGSLGRLLDEHTPEEVAALLREESDRREFHAYAKGWRDAAAHFTPALEEARLTRARTLRLVEDTPGQAAVIPFLKDRNYSVNKAAEHADEPGTRGRTPAPDSATNHPGAVDGDAAATGNTSGRSEKPAKPGRAVTSRTGTTPVTEAPAPPGPSTETRAPAPEPTGTPESTGTPEPASTPEPADTPEPAGRPAASRSARPAFAPKSRSSKVPTIPRLSAIRRPRRAPPSGPPVGPDDSRGAPPHASGDNTV
ncbi:hypothetical protein ACWDZ4_07325 [Streptomyces sp. NPDC003016]